MVSPYPSISRALVLGGREYDPTRVGLQSPDKLVSALASPTQPQQQPQPRQMVVQSPQTGAVFTPRMDNNIETPWELAGNLAQTWAGQASENRNRQAEQAQRDAEAAAKAAARQQFANDVASGMDPVQAAINNPDPEIQNTGIAQMMQQAGKVGDGYTLGEGQTRFDAQGNPIASVPKPNAGVDLIPTDKPIFNPQNGTWTMPPQPDGGGPMFQGTSTEATGLNYLVDNNILTRQQAAEVAAGKTITGPNGEIIFMTPTGIFSKASPDAAAVPIGPNPQAPSSPDPLATAPQRPGMIPLTTPPPGGNLTPAEKAVDTTYAKEYADWTAAGGYADIDKQLEQLNEAVRTLESGRDDITGPIIGGVIGQEWLAPGVIPDAVATKEAVEEVVQRNLRLILGAQFTQKEGERLIARAYNPNLSEAENAKRVRRLITQIRSAAEAKQAAADYFSQHGTLKGWQGTIPTFADFHPEADTPAGAMSVQQFDERFAPSDIDALIQKYGG